MSIRGLRASMPHVLTLTSLVRTDAYWSTSISARFVMTQCQSTKHWCTQGHTPETQVNTNTHLFKQCFLKVLVHESS